MKARRPLQRILADAQTHACTDSHAHVRTHRHTTHIESELVIKDRQLDDIRVGGL